MGHKLGWFSFTLVNLPPVARTDTWTWSHFSQGEPDSMDRPISAAWTICLYPGEKHGPLEEEPPGDLKAKQGFHNAFVFYEC